MTINTTIQEVKLRGAFIMQSCDLEMTLLHIMLYCIVDVEQQTIIKNGFRKMMLGDKIKKTIEVLKTYRAELYTKYESYFVDLESIKTLRNQMAHCTIKWEKMESENMSFEFLEIIKGEGKDEKFDPIKMSVRDAYIRLVEFRNVCLKMADLASVLIEEFRIKYPGILKPV